MQRPESLFLGLSDDELKHAKAVYRTVDVELRRALDGIRRYADTGMLQCVFYVGESMETARKALCAKHPPATRELVNWLTDVHLAVGGAMYVALDWYSDNPPIRESEAK